MTIMVYFRRFEAILDLNMPILHIFGPFSTYCTLMNSLKIRGFDYLSKMMFFESYYNPISYLEYDSSGYNITL